MKSRQFSLLIGLVVLTTIAIFFYHPDSLRLASHLHATSPILQPATKAKGQEAQSASQHKNAPPSIDPSQHPVYQLTNAAEKDFQEVINKQSKTLVEAVAEYQRRYGLPPPPHFDKWYEFARDKGVQLIDEYDNIHSSLTPFWGLKPSTIRGRAREVLGFPNSMMGLLIRKGEVTKISGGYDWQQNATVGMMKGFLKYLPDMDLAFNTHDEPRVSVPFDDMVRLLATAKDVNMPQANAAAALRNSWSPRPKDVLGDGQRFEEVKTTRFNEFAHQPTWTHSRVSCPPESPARRLDDGPKEDNFDSYAVTELGFIYNQTAFTDICQSPSLSESFGFFDRPNSYSIGHDLFPVFSQSKLSSYNDIIYPSPWYWYGKVPYHAKEDMAWAEKEDKIYWRGSTTGGFSRDGGWRRQHRQRVVKKINAGDQAKILFNRGDEKKSDWQVKSVPRDDFKDMFDVYFTYVGQCDEGDCAAQKEFFDIKPGAKPSLAWGYKYLLDMDGNAFSGRFYSFLRSNSLVYKLAVFREWHDEWLKPWVHFIPMSLRGDEWVETARFYSGEEMGKHEAQRMAMQGQQWANKVLRNEDLEVWFFRLLLEQVSPPLDSKLMANKDRYGRVIDDDRESIGYRP